MSQEVHTQIYSLLHLGSPFWWPHHPCGPRLFLNYIPAYFSQPYPVCLTSASAQTLTSPPDMKVKPHLNSLPLDSTF